MQLSDMQQDFLANCSHRWNVKTGATRSGKTFLDCSVVIPQRILATRGEGLIVLMGNTIGTFERNVLSTMRSIWSPELVGNIRTGPSGNQVQLFGRQCQILGADNKKHVSRLQGAAIEYAYGDEVTTWDEGVFSMLKSRLSCEHSHFDGTCNPEGPGHWFKKFLDSDADVFCQAYTIDDNPYLPRAFVEALKQEYSGTVYYNRYILGQWMAAEGVVYRAFADDPKKFLWTDDRRMQLQRVCIGVDFGGNGSKHAFVATGATGGYRDCIALASRRTEPGDVDQLVNDFLQFAQEVLSRYGRIDAIYCDSAEQVIIRQIRAETARSSLGALAGVIYNAKKIAITDRIRLTSILMGSGRFWYTEQAGSLRDALMTSVWSEKHAGKDERLDDGTTDIDSLDAFEYTIERDRAHYLRM